MLATATEDEVWRALADPVRRSILDLLCEAPQTTGDIVSRFPLLSRTGVMKHLDVLVKAELIVVKRAGRVRWNHLNAVPLEQICHRWLNRHTNQMAGRLRRLKEVVEAPREIKTMTKNQKTRESTSKSRRQTNE